MCAESEVPLYIGAQSAETDAGRLDHADFRENSAYFDRQRRTLNESKHYYSFNLILSYPVPASGAAGRDTP